MPPGVSHASKTGQPDAIPAASPVIPPPSIQVFAPRLVKFVVPITEIHYSRESTSRFREPRNKPSDVDSVHCRI
jgi:hypothetical protein